MTISKSLKQNIQSLKQAVKGDDVIYFNFKIGEIDATAIYLESLSDKELLGKQVISPLMNLKGEIKFDDIIKLLTLPEADQITDMKSCIEKVTGGDAIVFIDGHPKAFSAACKNPAVRSVTEPPTSSVLKGPREGFVESLQTNMSLLRRRIKSPDLSYEKITVGKYSSTTIGLIYISGVANEKIVNVLRDKIKQICVDGIIDSSYVIKCISERKTSMFKDVGTTEKPDILAAKLLEGRVGIIVDGSPIALTAPFLLVEDFQSSEDYFVNTYRANISRCLRLLAVAMAILLPAFFVSSQLYHLQLLPLNFLVTIVGSIKGIPLSPNVEMFLTVFIFEILNEASIRMPKYVGVAMSVVGALVLGETAVNAGIVSTPTIMIIALSGICIYTVPDLTETLSVLRLMFLIVGGTLGGYGIILFGVGLITYLASIDSFGTPYLAPLAPIIKNDLKDGILTDFYVQTTRRPQVFNTKNKIRKRFKNE